MNGIKVIFGGVLFIFILLGNFNYSRINIIIFENAVDDNIHMFEMKVIPLQVSHNLTLHSYGALMYKFLREKV